MKSTLFVCLLYLLLALLAVSCSEEEEVSPACVRVEVVGSDCQNGWFLLRILEEEGNGQRSKEYVGQLPSGFVTTDNLPLELQQPGLLLDLSLELYGDHGPLCFAVHMMYPPVKVKQVCGRDANGT
ncbi:hypothetical protein [Pontibacter roseus]|uniref:hypothetical protein n=1 Tax=Pontibacter roseus TaxID=336989 RepID=UPI0003773484|nr:hypothetical protein [Pontibacter roseus]